MHRTDIDTATVSPRTQNADSATWTCSVCGVARLCPYAAPFPGDPTEVCRSCGDLLARQDTRGA
jgi:hypothetical protein